MCKYNTTLQNDGKYKYRPHILPIIPEHSDYKLTSLTIYRNEDQTIYIKNVISY